MPSPSRPVRPLAVLALAGALALTGACGSSDPAAQETPTTPSPTSSAPTSTAPAPSGQVVEITVGHDDVTPAGKKVELDRGETLTLKITAEEAGELHVHSTPEQAIDFPAGESSHEITLDRPGLYEVESHHPAKLVLQLQVS